jgi:Heat induced stress protein YflT
MVHNLQVRGLGLFSETQPLEQAIEQLKTQSFDLSHISVIARGIEKTVEAEAVQVSDHIGDQSVDSSTGVVTDAVRSATWGSLLVGLTSLAIPGLGAVIAAGSVGVALLTGLAGAGLGLANFNNLVQAFSQWGITEADARLYSERLSSGDYLVIVEGSPDELEAAGQAFGNAGVESWRIYPIEAEVTV